MRCRDFGIRLSLEIGFTFYHYTSHTSIHLAYARREVCHPRDRQSVAPVKEIGKLSVCREAENSVQILCYTRVSSLSYILYRSLNVNKTKNLAFNMRLPKQHKMPMGCDLSFHSHFARHETPKIPQLIPVLKRHPVMIFN